MELYHKKQPPWVRTNDVFHVSTKLCFVIAVPKGRTRTLSGHCCLLALLGQLQRLEFSNVFNNIECDLNM